jgi:hypothetical protein
VPGKELEKAAADVSREAGKSITRGIARLFNAQFGTWIARKEATAEAARIAIETQADVDRTRALIKEHRNQELEELEHQTVKSLAERRFQRLFIEMAREQSNFEAISAQSLYIAEHDSDENNPREIDEDWMFKFADYAQDVSDKEVQELWSRILSSAAIGSKLLLSPAALQAMSLLDKRGASDFDKFYRVFATFKFLSVGE